jgi:hypothetical protein
VQQQQQVQAGGEVLLSLRSAAVMPHGITVLALALVPQFARKAVAAASNPASNPASNSGSSSTPTKQQQHQQQHQQHQQQQQQRQHHDTPSSFTPSSFTPSFLTSVNVSHCRMHGSSLGTLLRSLLPLHSVSSLDVSHQHLREEGLRHLAVFLRHDRCLRSLTAREIGTFSIVLLIAYTR